MSDLTTAVLELSHLRSTHIAAQLGCSSRYVRRILKRHGLAHRVGPPDGEANPAWVGGRRVDADGYVALRTRPKRVLEHRAVMEKVLGRPLEPREVVDHIDGITIHNDPANLRLFANNGDHLCATTAGKKHQVSVSGRRNTAVGKLGLVGPVFEPVDTYRRRKARGDIRLRAILRAALELGIGHPCLSGTTHWLEQNGIDPRSRPSLEQAWDALERRYALDLLA